MLALGLAALSGCCCLKRSLERLDLIKRGVLQAGYPRAALGKKVLDGAAAVGLGLTL